MAILSKYIELNTQGFSDIIDITPEVTSILYESHINEGILTAFITGSTGAITTIEYETGVVNDLKKAIERIAPQNIHYDHDARWGDGNGFSHVRAALLGPSIQIPFTNGKLALGTWQQIVFCDFDNRARHRKIFVQIFGK